MKEIDFLPEWYKSGRRRQFSYRTQYIALGGVLFVMMVWSFVAVHSISKAKAQIAQMSQELTQAEDISAKLAELQNEMSLLHKRQGLLQKIDSRINVANVLAELSSLISNQVVLSRVEITAESFGEQQDYKSTPIGAVVRAVRSDFGTKQEMPLGDVRFNIVIAGVAADGSDVADLIRNLEDSPYFSSVVLCFSRSAEIETQSDSTIGLQAGLETSSRDSSVAVKRTNGNIQASRFEISCYLANYREL